MEQASSHSASNPPNIIVQISQHSSLDRDLYVAYQSSFSLQGTSSLSSSQTHPNSGFEGSLPPTTEFPGDSNGIIPDSQSLPGSSSYAPPSSTPLALLGADQAPQTQKFRVSQNSTDLESSTGGIAEANNSIEDSSVAVVASSQYSVINSERSRSEPAPNTKASSTSLSGARLPSLPRSISDPHSYNDQHRRRAFVSKYEKDHRITRDRVSQSLADVQSPQHTQVPRTQQRQSSSEVQVPRSAEKNAGSDCTSKCSPAPIFNFQTQVPLAFASQGSRVSITSAGTSSRELTLSQRYRVKTVQRTDAQCRRSVAKRAAKLTIC